MIARAMSSTELNVDCYGTGHLEQVSVQVSGYTVNFIFEPSKKQKRSFSYGLFLDDAALSSRFLLYPRNRRLALLTESPIREVFRKDQVLRARFDYVFTHYKPLLDQGKPFCRFYFGTNWLGYEADGPELACPKSKNISFMGSIQHGNQHGYSLRKAVAGELIENPAVDCFGKGIKEIPSKLQALAPYRFSIALENVREDFYFTEKLVDCLLTDTVPVYWGCPGITQLFDARGLILFATLEELRAVLPQLTPERYEQMLPFVRANKQRVIAQKWHSLTSLYQRLGQELLVQLGTLSPVTWRPRLLNWLIRQRQ